MPESNADASAKQPWMGLASYGEGEAELFHGRTREIEAVDRLVHREAVTVMFGPSGTGKSSLLNAGLFPRWRAEQRLPVSLRVDYSGKLAPDRQIRESVAAAVAEAGIETVPLGEPLGEGDESAWEFLHRHAFWDERNRPVTPVLVFDQFEEVFTLGSGRPETGVFLEQLADLAENYVPVEIRRHLERTEAKLPRGYLSQNYRIVLSLREDFVSRLDSLNKSIPSVMLNRFSLERMNGRQALEAVLKPGGDLVDEPVARGIIEFVSTRKSAIPGPSGEEDPEAEFEALQVEPALLSLVCRELNTRRLKQGQPSITREQLEASSDDILEDFYENSFDESGSSGRIFVEDRFVTASGFRSTVPAEDARESGLAEAEIAALIDRRLLRKEDRLGIPHLELTHDVLTGVVRQSRDHRRERERLEAERQEREERARRTRKLVLTLGVAMLVFFFVGLGFLFLWLKAERQAKINFANGLIATAQVKSSEGDPDLGLLLKAAAYHRHVLDLGRVESKVKTAYRESLSSHLVETLARRKSIRAVAWSPGKNRLAFVGKPEDAESESEFFEIWNWDPESGGAQVEKREFAGGKALAWSGDGGRLAIGNQAGEIVVWDLEKREMSEPIALGSADIKSIEWELSVESGRLAWGNGAGQVGILDLASRASFELAGVDGKAVNAVSWGPEGVHLASADDLGRIRIWNVEDRVAVETIEEAHPDEVWSLSWKKEPEGVKLLASGGKEGTIRIWDLSQPAEDREQFPTLLGHDGGVRDLVWADGRLISAGWDATIRVWESDSGDSAKWETRSILVGHKKNEPSGGVGDLAWNGRHLASGGRDGTVRIWDPANEIGPGRRHEFDEALSSVAWSPEGTHLAIGSAEGKVWVKRWDAPGTSDAGLPFSEEKSAIRAVAWEPDGDRLAIASNDGPIRIREPSGGVIEELEGDGSFSAVAWKRDGGRLAAASESGRIHIWESRGWQSRVGQPFPADGENLPIYALVWNAGGGLAWGDDAGRIRVWKGDGGEPLDFLQHDEFSYSIAWADAGESLMAISEGRRIRIWNVPQRREIYPLEEGAHTNDVSSMAWTPDGRRIASADSDGVVLIWEPAAQLQPIHRLKGHDSGVSEVAWDPSGSRLVSVSTDGSARIWSFDEASWLKRAKRLVNRNLTEHEWSTYIGLTEGYKVMFEELESP